MHGVKNRANSTAAAARVAVGCECCLVEVERVTPLQLQSHQEHARRRRSPAQLISTLQAQQVGGPALQLLEQQLAPIPPVQVLCRAVGVHPACMQPAGRCAHAWMVVETCGCVVVSLAESGHVASTTVTLTPSTFQPGCCK